MYTCVVALESSRRVKTYGYCVQNVTPHIIRSVLLQFLHNINFHSPQIVTSQVEFIFDVFG